MIGAPDREAARHHLNIQPAAAAGAVVDTQAGMPRQQVVPHLVKTLDVADLGHADAIRRIRGLPELSGSLIEILPVPGHAEIADEIGDHIGKALAGGGDIQDWPAPQSETIDEVLMGIVAYEETSRDDL